MSIIQVRFHQQKVEFLLKSCITKLVCQKIKQLKEKNTLKQDLVESF